MSNIPESEILSVESLFLKNFFDRINEAEIEYCVLRNYESLPYSLNGSDLDILVGKTDLLRFREILTTVVRDNGGNIIAQYKTGLFYGMCFCAKSPLGWWGVQCDVYSEIVYRGIPYYDSQKVLTRSIMNNQIRICHSTDSDIITALKECLPNSIFRKDYYQKAVYCYRQDPSYHYFQTAKNFGEKAAIAWDRLLNSGGTKDVKKIAKIIRIGLFKTNLTRKPFQTCKNFIHYQIDRFSRLFRRPGFFIAFLGSDGAGKSSIINLIQLPLESALHGALCYEHLRPNFLPSLARLFHRNENQISITEPHKSSPSGFWGSLVRLTYYTCDYITGFWLKVYPEMVRRPTLFIFDRYFYDYLFDPRRSRINLPTWIIKLFSILIPKPDLIFCLGANPEIMHARKPELPLDEIVRQIEILKAFCTKEKRTVWIDTSHAPERSADEALSVIVQRMAARYES